MRTLGLAALISVALVPIAFAADWFGPFCDRVVSEGKASTLPPHLSLVLGLGDGVQPVPVKQAGKRDGHAMRTVNVVQGQQQRRVVLMEDDAQTQRITAFLVRPNGKLVRAVTYAAGAQPETLGTAKARAGLQQQLTFWAKEARSMSEPIAPTH